MNLGKPISSIDYKYLESPFEIWNLNKRGDKASDSLHNTLPESFIETKGGIGNYGQARARWNGEFHRARAFTLATSARYTQVPAEPQALIASSFNKEQEWSNPEPSSISLDSLSADTTFSIASIENPVWVKRIQSGSEYDSSATVFRFYRSSTDLSENLTIYYGLSGLARSGIDYLSLEILEITIPTGSDYADLVLPTIPDNEYDPGETVAAYIIPKNTYDIAPGGRIAESIITADGLAADPEPIIGYIYNKTQREGINGGAYCVLLENGQILTLGRAELGGSSDGILNSQLGTDEPTEALFYREVYQSASSFAALRSDGAFVAAIDVSPDNIVNPMPIGLENDGKEISRVVSSGAAYGIIYKDGSYGIVSAGKNEITWNDADNPVIDAVTTSNFGGEALTIPIVALLQDGGLLVGSDTKPVYLANPDSVPENPSQLKILSIYSSGEEYGFLADDGYFYSSPLVLIEGFYVNPVDNDALFPLGTIFADKAFTFARVSTESKDIVKVVSTLFGCPGFLLLMDDGSVISSASRYFGDNIVDGHASLPYDLYLDMNGQSIYIIDIFSTGWGFGALRSDGSFKVWQVYPPEPYNQSPVLDYGPYSADFNPWSIPYYGGDEFPLGDLAGQYGPDGPQPRHPLPDIDPEQLGDRTIVKVLGSFAGFSALLDDGTVLVYGDVGWGSAGWVHVRADFQNLRVLDFVNTADAFAAILENGDVATWGIYSQGGYSGLVVERFGGFTTVPDSDIEVRVVQLYAHADGFVALRSDGSIILWGDLPYYGDQLEALLFQPSTNTEQGLAAPISIQLSSTITFSQDEEGIVPTPINGKAISYANTASRDTLLSEKDIVYNATASWLNDGSAATPGNLRYGYDYLWITSYIEGQAIKVDPLSHYFLLDNYTTPDGKSGIALFLDDGVGKGGRVGRRGIMGKWDERDELVALIETQDFRATEFSLKQIGEEASYTIEVENFKFTLARDLLTGVPGCVNIYQLEELNNSLLGDPESYSFDSIIGFNTLTDRIYISSESSFSTRLEPSLAGSVRSLDQNGIAKILNETSFQPDSVAIFTFRQAGLVQTFLAINNDTPGYQSEQDAIINITGYSGPLSSIAIYSY